MDKEYTSNVEDSRFPFEEPVTIKGTPIYPEQVWRDGKLIPTTAPDIYVVKNGNYAGISLYSGKVGVVEYYDKAPLVRVAGTNNCFSAPYLKNAIPESWDSINNSYAIHLFTHEGEPLAFGRGLPEIDTAAGTLTFTDDAFIDSLDIDAIQVPFLISFYRYAGNTGFLGDDGLYLPFPDSTSLLRSKDDPTATARFLVRGGTSKDMKYILPPNTGVYYENTDPDSAVVVMQENLNRILNTIGIIDGGRSM